MDRSTRVALRAFLAAGTLVPLAVGAVSLASQMRTEERRVRWMATTSQVHPNVGMDDGEHLRTMLFTIGAICGIAAAAYEFALAGARKAGRQPPAH